MALTHEQLNRLIIEITQNVPLEKSQLPKTPETIKMRAKLEANIDDIKAKGGTVEMAFYWANPFD